MDKDRAPPNDNPPAPNTWNPPKRYSGSKVTNSSKIPNPKLLFGGKHHKHVASDERHHSLLGEHAADLWRYNKITDIVVKFQDKSYPAHKAVLSCYSEYFRDLLLNSTASQNIIHLSVPSVTSEAFEVLLSYMYTAELKLTCQNVGDVYTASRKLMMKDALDKCVDLLTGKIKHRENSLYVFVTARKLGMTDSSLQALHTMVRNFEYIIGTDEFLQLTWDQVCEFLSYDELAVRSEVIVYLAALRWLNAKFLEREKYAEVVISCIRFPLMTLNEVLACYSPPLLPGIVEVHNIQDLLLKATWYKILNSTFYKNYIAAKTVNEEERFTKFSCKPRVYLVEREPIIVWDPNIFLPERYEQYRQEMAATKIQSLFRGYLTRRKLRRQFAKELEDQYQAASKIQAGYRGFSTRKRLKSATDIQDMGPESFEGESMTGSKPQALMLDETYRRKLPGELEKTSKTIPTDKRTPATPTTLMGSSLESLSTNIQERISTGMLYDDSSSPTRGKEGRWGRPRPDTLGDFRSKGFVGPPSSPLSLGERPGSYDSSKPPSENGKKKVRHNIYTEPAATGGVSDESYPRSTTTTEESLVVPGKTKMPMIFVLGGFNPDDISNDVSGRAIHRFTVKENRWDQISEMPIGRHHLCVVYLNECLYCIGGCDPQVTKEGKMIAMKSCWKFNIATNVWSSISEMHHCRMYHGAAIVTNKIFVAGGKDEGDHLLDSVEFYEPNQNIWQLLGTSLNSPKMGFGICSHENQLWIAGGMIQDHTGKVRVIQEVESYDPAQNSWWRHLAMLPSPRGFCSLVERNGRIFAIGGASYSERADDKTIKSIPDVDWYNDAFDEWVADVPLPSPRHYVAVVNIDDDVYAIGGLTTYQTALDEILILAHDADQWELYSSMPEYVCGFAVASASPGQ